MSEDIIKTSSTKSFLPIRKTSFLRKTKLQRGLSIAIRFNIRHCHRHVVACRQRQGASNMIRQSAARGSQGAKEPVAGQVTSAQVQAKKSWREVMLVSARISNETWTHCIEPRQHFLSLGTLVGTLFGSQVTASLGTQTVSRPGSQAVIIGRKPLRTRSELP